MPTDLLRSQLLERIAGTRSRTDRIFDCLLPPAFLARPIAERHRLVFYLGHLEAFDWNLLVRDGTGAPSRRPDWERLFAFGIDPLDGGLPDDQPDDWPDVAAIRAWGRELRADVDRVLATAPFTGWLQDGHAAWIALEHRTMHQETLAYLLHQLPLECLAPGPVPTVAGGRAPDRDLVAIPAGHATLGRRRGPAAHPAWDNEFDEHRVFVPAFAIERHAVTNADWLGFMTAGGYREAALWDEADQAFRLGRQHPAFWRPHAEGFRLRAMFGEVPLPPHWPVWVSHAEASAYARWRGLRLPTEAQWHRAALGTPAGGERPFPWGGAPPRPGLHGNFGRVLADPAPVDAHPQGQSAFGVHGLVGNGWQWTRTPFAPFPGFRPLPFYPGYSADFFDGRHFVLKGGSPVTDVALLRRSFRNWFQPHYPWVYAALRCVHEG